MLFVFKVNRIPTKNNNNANNNEKENIVSLSDDMKLEPIGDWETVNDDLLAKIINETNVDLPVDSSAIQENSTGIVSVQNWNPKVQTSTKTQINTINNTQKSPFLPQMYFPNSNVTINYHFHK